MQHIRAISLDLDDTLWEIEPVITRAEAELWCWLTDNCPQIAQRFDASTALRLREDIAAEFLHKSHDFRFLRKMVLGRMAAAAGYPDDVVDAAFKVFDAARNQVELFPDVMPALTALAGGFTIVAVTNGNADLERIGIRHLFHEVVTAVDAGAAKPEAAIFEEAVRRAGVAPSQVLHVGDNPECDVAGAKAAGLATAWMNRRGDDWPLHLEQPDAVVASVDELLALLKPAFDIRRAGLAQ